jgi:NADPH:quinone reductase-like Zn-dependent oxidoreductase
LRSIVVFDPAVDPGPGVELVGEAAIGETPVAVGLADSVISDFDPDDVGSRSLVLLEVLAFSCNYRDRAIILGHLAAGDGGAVRFGSDFVATVRAVGRDVDSVAVGDRVIADNTYPQAPFTDVRPGIPTNGASARFLVLHECKLAKVPEAMPVPLAAGFGIAAQTAYSMIRRLDVRGGERCLVTGASSQTSQFVLAALVQFGVETYAVTTGLNDFSPLGVAGTIRVRPPFAATLSRNEIARRLIREHGGPDLVVDPFSDLYATAVIPLLKSDGSYVTCGIYAQSMVEPRIALSGREWRDLLATIIKGNLTIHGNCLGQQDDLARAIAAYDRLAPRLPPDSVFGPARATEFVARSFTPTRFGKAILRYVPEPRSPTRPRGHVLCAR